MVIRSVAPPKFQPLARPASQAPPPYDEEFPPEDQRRIRLLTGGGAVAGSVALGLGTSYFEGPTETLVGFAQGSIAGAAVGAAAGAAIATWLLSDPDTQGRIGLAIVGGALGGVTGLLVGGVAGAYVGNAGGNVIGYIAGAALGAGTGYIAGRLTSRAPV